MIYDIDTILKDYKKSSTTLCDIFGVLPEMYRNIEITKIDFSARVKTALQRGGFHFQIPTLYDLLTLTVPELLDIRLLGRSGVQEVFTVLQNYLFNTKPHIVRKTYGDGINIYRLGRAIKTIMEDKEIDYSEYRPTELPYLEKYKEAVTVIDKELYIAAYNNEGALVDIMNAFYRYSIPKMQTINNKAEIETAFNAISVSLKNKPIIMYLTSYCKRCGKDINDFELSRKDMTIIEYHISIINSEILSYSKMRVIKEFYIWLKFNLSRIVEMIVVPITDRRAETVVFNMFIGGQSVKQIASKLEVSTKNVRKYIDKEVSRFLARYRGIDYDLVLALYSLQPDNCYELTYNDFLEYIDHNNAHLIWNAIKHAGSRFGNSYYEYDKENNRILFDI